MCTCCAVSLFALSETPLNAPQHPPPSDSEQEDAPAPKAPRRLVVGADDSDDEPPMRRPSSNGAVEVDLPPAEGSAPQGPPGQEAPAEGGGGQPTLRVLGELESRLLQWQWANAEYGNSACLDKVSCCRGRLASFPLCFWS